MLIPSNLTNSLFSWVAVLLNLRTWLSALRGRPGQTPHPDGESNDPDNQTDFYVFIPNHTVPISTEGYLVQHS